MALLPAQVFEAWREEYEERHSRRRFITDPSVAMRNSQKVSRNPKCEQQKAPCRAAQQQGEAPQGLEADALARLRRHRGIQLHNGLDQQLGGRGVGGRRGRRLQLLLAPGRQQDGVGGGAHARKVALRAGAWDTRKGWG